MNKLVVRFALFGLLLFTFPVNAERFPDFPVSKKMNIVIAANNIEYNGIPTRIYQFDTELDVEQLTSYYADEWSDMNQVNAGDRRILSHRSGDYLLTVQIELSAHPVTHGILVTSPVFKLLDMSDSKIRKRLKGIGKDFPVLPDTTFISDIKGQEATGESRSLLFFNNYDVDQNIDFYRQKMLDNGWRSVLANAASDGQAVLAMNKNGRKFNISFSTSAGKTHGVAVFLP